MCWILLAHHSHFPLLINPRKAMSTVDQPETQLQAHHSSCSLSWPKFQSQLQPASIYHSSSLSVFENWAIVAQVFALCIAKWPVIGLRVVRWADLVWGGSDYNNFSNSAWRYSVMAVCFKIHRGTDDKWATEKCNTATPHHGWIPTLTVHPQDS